MGFVLCLLVTVWVLMHPYIMIVVTDEDGGLFIVGPGYATKVITAFACWGYYLFSFT